MSFYARINDGIVAERPVDLPDKLTPTDCFVPDIASTFVPCDSTITQGMTWDGKSFGPAPAPVQAPVAPDTTLSFMAFIGLFTTSEQSAIISSDDPQIKLFCLMAAGASIVDLADLRTVAGTQELETLGLIGKGRAKQVLAGQAPPTS